MRRALLIPLATLILADTHAVPVLPPPAPQYQDDVMIPEHASNLEWHRVSYNVTPQEDVREFVPAGQSGADWHQIITVKILPLSRDPHMIVDNTIAFMRTICRQVKILATAPTQRTGEAASLDIPLPTYESSEQLTTCDSPDQAKLTARLGPTAVKLRRYEVTWYRIMLGTKANYIVQRAWHGDTMDETSPLGSDTVLADWKQWISHITLRRRGADAH